MSCAACPPGGIAAAVDAGCARIGRLFEFIFRQWGAEGFTDTAYDRLGGVATGFLQVNLQGRGPYPCADDEDVAAWRRWCSENFPELLRP